ncbi:hypothetical protein [Mycobacteroides salmoniphilum]|uniref:Uncharacterized protein n=1 Tax=Mycobacteroides salmoniphilum TaxID=404941 RepID=A0A4R8SXB6_9MYCO|nr:hypothetical protein [Mycobacteroides salmoniphilum]TDZ89806.1 hypothetical protein CCUG62472_04744 [Mycobacteroides salmoniphilum]TEA07980.1 hypothetical protein CCUG60884_00458 [Mycobacteroides salmoniphilum]
MSENRAAKSPFTGGIIVAGGIFLILAVANSTSWGAEEERPRPTHAVTESANPAGAEASSPQCQQQQLEPQCDGTFRVAGDNSPTGIPPGWIHTEGPHPGSHQHCLWIRLSGQEMTMENTLATGKVTEGPATVQIKPSDYAFATYGCQSWQKVG